MVPLFRRILCFALLLVAFQVRGQLIQDLEWEQLAIPNLPASVKVFETFTPFPNGSPLHATYTEIDLSDPNLELFIDNNHPDGPRLTPLEYIDRQEEPVFVATNGGFFTSSGLSVNLIIQDGEFIARGQEGVNRVSNVTGQSTTYFPTWTAWGLLPDGQQEIVWTWPAGEGDDQFAIRFPEPYPNSLNQEPLPVPFLGTYTDENVSITGTRWDVVTATGGTPALVVDGVVDVKEEELINDGLRGKNPRTAMGYTADNKLIIMVVDGRQSEFSVGATLPELAEMMIDAGAFEAINLDGGGSSVMIADNEVITRPSDAEGIRAVGSALLIRRVPQIYDTENTVIYAEAGDGWFSSSNPGFFGDSPTRLAPVGDGTLTATYTLPDDLPPASYTVGTWFVGASNRSSQTPYVIVRDGFGRDTIFVNQTLNSGAFNPIGTFPLGPGDQIIISNAAPNGDFVAVDALRLQKEGESEATVVFPGGSQRDIVQGQSTDITANFQSNNSGVTVETLRIFKQVNDGPEEALQTVDLNGTTTDAFTLNLQVDENVGDLVNIRFELEDNQGRLLSQVFQVRVVPFDIAFDPEPTSAELNVGQTVEFDVVIATPNVSIDAFTVFQSVNGGAETIFAGPLNPGTTPFTFPFSYTVIEDAGDEVAFRFEVSTTEGTVLDRSYTAEIVPARSNIRIGFINDFNGSFGSTTYDQQVLNAMDYLRNEAQVDIVLSSGDMIAAQSAGLTDEQLRGLWAAFNQFIYQPFRDENISFGFSLGNHDASRALDRQIAEEFWTDPAIKPDLINYVEDSNFPFYYAFTAAGGEVFVAALDGPGSGFFGPDEVEWLREQFQSPQAQNAKYKFALSHLPLFAAGGQNKNTAGQVLSQRNALLELFDEFDVTLFAAADHAVYYPGKRRGVELLHLGEMAGAGRNLVGTGQPTPATVTIIDLFDGDPVFGDSLVITTRALNEGFRFVDTEEFPTALFPFDGFTIRRDVTVVNEGDTELSGLNLPTSNLSTGTATAQARLQGDQIVIEGTFSDLEGKVLMEPTAIAVYTALHPNEGVPVFELQVNTTDGQNGTFNGTFPFDPNFEELLTVGFYYVSIKTEAFPDGEVRGQLYPLNDNAPTTAQLKAAAFPDSVFAVRDVLALFEVDWTAASDADGNNLTYVYQLARDSEFNDLLISSATLDSVFRELTESEWFEFLGDTQPGEPVTFFHRVIATDGKNQAVGNTETFRLTKDESPVTEPVQIPPPNYVPDGIFAEVPGFRVYDAAIDENTGRVWTTGFSSPDGFRVYNADGTPYLLTDPDLVVDGLNVTSINFQGISYDLSPTYGIEWLPDNTVIVASDEIWKLDATTGKVLAFLGGEQGSNPSVDNQGRVFYHNVFPGNGARIVQRSTTDTTTFEIVSEPNLSSGPAVARTSAFAPEGNVIYLPDASAARGVFIYTSDDGLNFEFSSRFDMPAATGSNAIVAVADSAFYVINNRGDQPPRLIFVDQKNQVRWDLPLDDVPDNDIRGFTISQDRKTILFGGETDRLYKYILDEPGPFEIVPLTIKEAKSVNSEGIANNNGVYAQLNGVVNSPNFSSDGLDFYPVENGEGIRALRFGDPAGYSVAAGDSIALFGFLSQVEGEVRINVDSVRVLSTENDLTTTMAVGALTEANESNLVTISNVSLVDPAQWTTGTGFFGFEVDVTDGNRTFPLLIDRETDLFNAGPPSGSFEVTGFVMQFDPTVPFLGGYMVLPRSTQDIALLDNVMVTADKTFVCLGESVTFTATVQNGVAPTFQWFNRGQAIPGATAATFTTSELDVDNLISVQVSDPANPYPITAPSITVNVTPEVAADETDNAPTNPVTLTFEDFAPWRTSITTVLVNSEPIAETAFAVTPGQILINSDVFPTPGIYAIEIQADGFCEVIVTQELLAAPPVLAADLLNNNVGNAIEVTFTDDPAWRAAVSEVVIDQAIVDPANFTLSEGLLTLDSSLFPEAGDYEITVNATGYVVAVVNQPINPQLIDLEVINPVSDVAAGINSDPITIDVSNVFGSPQDPNAEITVDVVDNSREDIVQANVADGTLTLSFTPEVFGESIITLRGQSGAASAETSFRATIVEPGLGNALFLNEDSGDELVNLGSPESLNFIPNQDDFTVTCWFNAAPGEVGTLVGKAAGGSRQYQLFTFGDEVLYQVGGTSVFTSSIEANYTPNEWHHVALVVKNSEGSSIQLYIDGQLSTGSATGNPPGDVLDDVDVLIGARWSDDAASAPSTFYNGLIDEVSFWNRALTAEEVQQFQHQLLSGSEPGLVAYYRFDQMGGTMVPDLSGNGIGGTLINTEDSDFVTSYAALAALPDNFQTDVEGLWDVQPALDANNGLDIISDVSGNNFAVLAHNGQEGKTDRLFNGVPIMQLNRSWFVERVGSSDIPATLAFDLSEAAGSGAALEMMAGSTFSLLTSEDGSNFNLSVAADSIINDTIYFNQPNLADGFYSLAVEEATSQLGQALFFDFSDEYVSLGSPEQLDFIPNEDNFTLSTWFNARPGEVGTLIAKAAGGSRQYQIFTFADEILYQVGGNSVSTIGGNANYTPDEWHHVALVVNNDENAVNLYLDGQFIRSSTPGSVLDPGIDVLFGARRTSDGSNGAISAQLIGRMDEVSFWNKALTQEEILDLQHQLLSGNEEGLVAYYRFDQQSGSILPDLGPNGLDGNLINMEDQDWITSYAALADLPEPFTQDIDGVWGGQPTSDRNGGLIIEAAINSVNYAVFGHNGATGTQSVEIDGLPTEQLNRVWNVFKNGIDAVPSTFVFDLGEAGSSNLNGRAQYALLSSTDGQFFTIEALSDSIENDSVVFEGVTLSNLTYTVGAPNLGDRVVRFQLVDRARNVIDADLSNGELINLNQTGNLDFNIQAITDPAVVGSVVLELSGPTTVNRVENLEPYEVFGNSAARLAVGTYTLKATPFDGASGRGEAGQPLEITFSVSFENAIERFDLLGADGEVLVSDFSDGAVIDLNTIGDQPLNIEAITTPPSIDAVQFRLEGPVSIDRLEIDPPYTVFSVPASLPVGDYTLAAQPVRENGMPTGPAKTIAFSVSADITIQQFDLTDADGTVIIADLQDNAVLNLNQLGNLLYNIEAGTTGAVGIVDFELSGPINLSRTEIEVPFLLFDDAPRNLLPGNYALTATPRRENGTPGTPSTINFKVTFDVAVTRFDLLDQNGDILISDLSEGAVIDLNTIGDQPLNIEAITMPATVDGISFSLQGPTPVERVEIDPPYTVFSFPTSLGIGDYSLMAQVVRADGTPIGTPLAINFSVVADIAVQQFDLTDAAGNVLLADLQDGATINLSQLGDQEYNIEAVASTAVGSVDFVLEGPVTQNRTEIEAPYFVFDNAPQRLLVGTYTLTATPRRADGTAGTARTLQFQVVTDEEATQFRLVDADRNVLEENLIEGAVIDLSKYPQGTEFNIEAVTEPTIASVVFDLNGPISTDRTENLEPFEVFGNGQRALLPGDYDLTAITFLQDGGQGMAEDTAQISFQVMSGTQFFPQGRTGWRATTTDSPLAVSIAPNPATDQLTITLSGTVEGRMHVQILDGNGRLVRRLQIQKGGVSLQQTIDLNGLAAGSYFLRIVGPQGNTQQQPFLIGN